MPISIQKASIWKRISAHLLDAILALILAVGFAFGVSAILKYDSHLDQLAAYEKEYAQIYGIDLTLSEDEINELPEEDQAKLEQATDAYHNDERVLKTEATLMYIVIAMVSVGAFLACLLVYFIIPLFFKNGQTLGKKVFGLAVMRTNCVKASNPVLFVRSMIGLYAMEVMAPIFLLSIGVVGAITLVLLVILEIVVMCVTKTNSSIHDLLSDTVVVDFASQQIFESEEELIEYKKELQAAEAAKSDY